MVTLLVMTGSALVTGLGAYKLFAHRERMPRHRSRQRRPMQAPLTLAQDGEPTATPSGEAWGQVEPQMKIQEAKEAAEYGLRTSAISLGLASTGLLIFAPLQYASVPMLIYMGVPPAQDAYEILHVEGRPSMALAETVVLAVCLASGYYWVSSLGFCLYHLGRRLYHETQSVDKLQPDLRQEPLTAHLLQNDDTIEVLTETLQVGDQIAIQAGEMVPADGVIVEGTASVLPCVLMHTAVGLVKRAGDKVAAADIVLVGRISVQVIKAA